jgi:starch synthase
VTVRVAFLSSELAPVAHVGGLGDVGRWLPAYLAAGGDEVAVFLPHYDTIDEGEWPVFPVPTLDYVPVPGVGSVTVSTLGEPTPDKPTVYLLDVPAAFRRGAIYPMDGDDHVRYATFVRAALAVCAALRWVPDVFHANDFHTALLPLHARVAGDPWDAVPTVLTIHNLAFQGVFPLADVDEMGLSGVRDAIRTSDAEHGNALATGIATADLVTTVSPTYAREILTPEQGMALEGELGERSDDLMGILNGIGDEWDPATDPWIAATYDGPDPERKAENRAALRHDLGLGDNEVPVLGVVSRLTSQKGFDLFDEAVVPLVEAGRAQLAVLGTGQPEYEELFADLAERMPRRVGYRSEFDLRLAHLIEAGSDLFLMPSLFEPCGLNQMYSMRYGTIPVVRATGGLADTVEPWDGAAGTGTGFVFTEYTADDFAVALEEALAVFADRRAWAVLVDNAMAGDWSWARRAGDYRAAYRRAITERAG